MSEPENFITRWSRRKREAAEGAEVTKSSIAPDAVAESVPPREDPRQERDALPASGGAPQPPEAAFDPAKLPPIETITAESDIRAFLAPRRLKLKYRPNRPPRLPRRLPNKLKAVRRRRKTNRPKSTMNDTTPMSCRSAIKQLLRRNRVQETPITIN